MTKLISLNLEGRTHRELPSGWSDLGKYFGYSVLAASTMIGSANCGGKNPSPSAPTPPPCGTPGAEPCPPTGNYVTVTNYPMKTRPEGGFIDGTMTLKAASEGRDVDIDIAGNVINITADKKIMAGTYDAVIRPKSPGAFYERTTPVIIANNSIIVPVEGTANTPTRTDRLEVILNGYDLQAYQSGSQFTEYGGGSRRWDVGANGENCPEHHIYTTLYHTAGSSLVRVDQNSVAPEVWAQWMQNISDGTRLIQDALRGSHTATDGRQYSGIAMATGGFCEPKITVEGPNTPLPDPNDRGGITSIMLPITDPVGGGIVNPAVYATYGPNGTLGKITHALTTYDAKTNWNSNSAFLVDMVFYAMGGHPPKSGPGSGFNPISILPNGNAKFLPEVFTITSLLYNRLPGHISNSQTPDFNSR